LSERVEHYLGLMNKYIKDAKELIAKGDYVQASEKLWGASAEMVKVVAAKRGIKLKTHRDIWDFVTKLHTESKDPELSKLFLQANYLHQNFYENILPAEAVLAGAEAVEQFIAKLEKLI